MFQFSIAPARAHSARFEIHAAACADLLARITGVVARAGLMPLRFQARRSCGGMWIALEAEIDAEPAERLADRLRGLIDVGAVVLIHRASSPAPTVPPAAAPHRVLVLAE